MTARAAIVRIAPIVVAGGAFCILIGLGTWQLQRLQWKNDLLARIEQRMHLAPRSLPPEDQWQVLDLLDWEYRPVTVTGRFDHAHEARVYTLLSEPRGALQGPGYMILTPLNLSDGSGTVLVNRGFVPQDKADPRDMAYARPESEVSVTGLLRGPEENNAFTPDDEPGKQLFFSRNARAIAEAYALRGPVAPFTVDADDSPNPGGLPQGGETRVVFPNRHLEYALTWYGLAAALAGVGLAWIVRHRRSGP